MKNVVCAWKRIGQTPLEAVTEFKTKHREYEKETVSYAGRLDPMAEGILLLLIGEENKKRQKYQELEKQYEVEIVFGLTTDSSDSLGLVKNNTTSVSLENIKKALNKFIGKIDQKFPPYSSKPVNGKPLFWWAKNNKLSQIEIPSHEVEIQSIKVMGFGEVERENLSKRVIKNVTLVNGDFRQEEIVSSWKKLRYEGKKITVTLLVQCSGGTYIRQLANDLGEALSCGAFCLSIKRTMVGEYSLEEVS